jgi:hypothetical protein
MTASPPNNGRLPVTPEALAEARAMIAAARHAALGSLSPDDGWPVVTRIGIAPFEQGRLAALVSGLTAHTPALLNDKRCALMIGEAGKGDPLAHPRLMLKCEARAVRRDDAMFAVVRAACLAAQPKAALYADLPDFIGIVFTPLTVSFNAGFGRAYAFEGSLLDGGSEAGAGDP